jgi:hypothetical protein
MGGIRKPQNFGTEADNKIINTAVAGGLNGGFKF